MLVVYFGWHAAGYHFPHVHSGSTEAAVLQESISEASPMRTFWTSLNSFTWPLPQTLLNLNSPSLEEIMEMFYVFFRFVPDRVCLFIFHLDPFLFNKYLLDIRQIGRTVWVLGLWEIQLVISLEEVIICLVQTHEQYWQSSINSCLRSGRALCGDYHIDSCLRSGRARCGDYHRTGRKCSSLMRTVQKQWNKTF